MLPISSRRLSSYQLVACVQGRQKPCHAVCPCSDVYDDYADLAVLTTVPILHSTAKLFVLKPIMIKVSVNGLATSLQVDTGAAASVLPTSLYHKSLSELPLEDATPVLQTYTSEQVKPQGQLALNVLYNSQLVEHKFLVLDAPGPALCGHDLLDKLRLDWAEMFALTHQPRTTPLGRVNMLQNSRNVAHQFSPQTTEN